MEAVPIEKHGKSWELMVVNSTDRFGGKSCTPKEGSIHPKVGVQLSGDT
jgi:hypothetical protein